MKLPRFTLRELFLLVVIAAMGCGWWVEHRRSRNDLARARDLVREEWEAANRWKGIAVGFAEYMRQEGLYARIDADGRGHSYGTSTGLNALYPLPHSQHDRESLDELDRAVVRFSEPIAEDQDPFGSPVAK
jgi:hypothetical protein